MHTINNITLQKEAEKETLENKKQNLHTVMRVGPKVSGLTYKSHTKWKMLRGIYSVICYEVNISVCVEIRGEYTEK
jgi:hypothetical protein